MKKKWSVVGLSLILGLSLAGCSSNDGKPSQKDISDAQKTVEKAVEGKENVSTSKAEKAMDTIYKSSSSTASSTSSTTEVSNSLANPNNPNEFKNSTIEEKAKKDVLAIVQSSFEGLQKENWAQYSKDFQQGYQGSQNNEPFFISYWQHYDFQYDLVKFEDHGVTPTWAEIHNSYRMKSTYEAPNWQKVYEMKTVRYTLHYVNEKWVISDVSY